MNSFEREQLFFHMLNKTICILSIRTFKKTDVISGPVITLDHIVSAHLWEQMDSKHSHLLQPILV